jgi:hypothetical protein
MHRRLGTALVFIALVAIPVAAGIIASSRPGDAPHCAHQHAKTQVSDMPLLGYGAPAKTSRPVSGLGRRRPGCAA